MEPRLKSKIKKEINLSLKEMFGYRNLYMGPKIEKIVLNMGLGLDGNDSKIINSSSDLFLFLS
jgi:large subunit ribosomal protein L5